MHRFWLLALSLLAAPLRADVTLTEGTNFSLDVGSDGRIVIDLLHQIWQIEPGQIAAWPIAAGELAASRPRLSADGQTVVVQATQDGHQQLLLIDRASGEVTRLAHSQGFDQHPDWHPDGERIVFSSARSDSGFDLWEVDLPTGLAWRISQLAGDETEPRWSADGRNLAYVHHTVQDAESIWTLRLRRFGQPDRVIVKSRERLSAPAWRPDGSLITFLRHAPDGLRHEMAILANPVLVRPLIEAEDFFDAPIAWRDRQSMLYVANGVIRSRAFNSWTSRTKPFRATLLSARRDTTAAKPPPLPDEAPPERSIVLRVARLYDGIGDRYRGNVDVVIEKGRIRAIESHAPRAGAIVVDMGDLTAVPGFIDSYATLPETIEIADGPRLLAFGLTTLVAEHPAAAELAAAWSGAALPGPRLLGPAWEPPFAAGTAVFLEAESATASPAGIQYADVRFAGAAASAAIIVSGLADAATPGLNALRNARQARALGDFALPPRRFANAPALGSAAPSLIVGSRPNGLAAGLGLHAEFRALAAAGLTPDQVLRSAGVNAAAMLGASPALGRLAVGSLADIVIVDGDPLKDIGDALKVVGIVRNGRFFSTIGLLERAAAAENVE